MQRRELFPILAATSISASAQHEHHKPARVSTSSYTLQTFSAEQNRILDALADILIPADSESGGAHEARVSQYFDLVATHLPDVRRSFEEGLHDLGVIARDRFEAPLEKLDRGQLTLLLETISEHEGNPSNGAETFFEFLKVQTIEGYRLSHIGQTKWLGYKPHPPGLYPDLTVD